MDTSGGDETVEIPSDELNRELVLGNRLLFGAVNAHHVDFERGIADLWAILEQWPRILDSFITRRLPIDRTREAIDDKVEGEIKTVIDIGG